MRMSICTTGGTVVNVSSTLGTLKNLSPKYQRYVTEASSIKELSKMPHIHDDPIKNIMVPCYSLTKAMMNRLTQFLAADPLLTSRKITINSVCPGWCRYAALCISVNMQVLAHKILIFLLHACIFLFLWTCLWEDSIGLAKISQPCS